MNKNFTICGTYVIGRKTKIDSNTGIYYKNGNFYVSLRKKGVYNTFAISKDDYNYWFNYFCETIILDEDDNDICDIENSKLIMDVESDNYDVEALYYDGEKFFINYANRYYQASKVFTKDEIRNWLKYHKLNDAEADVYADLYDDALDFVESVK